MIKKLVVGIPVIALALSGTTACATKKFVRTSVGEVNDKVDTLGRSLEETQERTRQNEAKISDVDQRAQAAATQARAEADKANTAAGAAATSANTANSRVAEVDKSIKRLSFEVVLNEDQGNFKFGGTDLPDPAKARLDEMIQQIKADPKGAFFEIEGHTDNVGAAEINHRIGLERAEAVKKYLYEQHQIPLHKMNVISYGEDKPVAPNKTRADRAMNRRVVVRVLA
jgi:outer membrane protein OmpA-like peptidoglycan-associated protein